jgi:penicillin G amidase
MRKFLFAIGTILLSLSAIIAQQSTVTVKGLTDTVTVRRDQRSIPYIEAKTDASLYFVQGYVTASDRLWQMDLLRRVARGETAEIFGPAALEEDKRWRRFGFSNVAQESLAHLSPDLRAALASYADGVNAYIATLDDRSLPVEFRILQYKPKPWAPADSVVIGKILADALSSTWRHDLVRASLTGLPKAKLDDLTNQVTPYDVVLFGSDTRGGGSLASLTTPRRLSRPGLAASDQILSIASRQDEIRESSLRRIGFYAEELAASNNWVISGKRTADGKPLLANDPHLFPSAPGIWYLTHLSTPAMRVAGVTFPGVPGIVLGHNEHFAWGATNVGPDVQDLYVETFATADAGGPECYKTPRGCEKVETRTELIQVRKSPIDTTKTSVPFEVKVTRHGPIILEEAGKRYALKWTAFDPKNNEFEVFFRLNRAKDWNEFKSALRTYGGATQNFVYADAKGNIGWYAAGRIPIRKVGDGGLPYDGATDDGEWLGHIPFDELPNLYNPREGFIVTANQRIVGTSYKYTQMSRDAAPPWRARRIYDLLRSNTKVTIDDVSAIQMDVHNIPLANLARQIVDTAGASPETVSVIRSWDGKMTPDSKAALVLNEIRACMANKIAADNMPAPANVIRERVLDRAVRERSARWLPRQYADYTTFMKACDTEANSSLTRRYGADTAKWVWGTVSLSRFSHPLAVAPLIGGQFATPTVPLAGSGQTPNVASFVSMRHIASAGNWDATRFVIPLGQSGDPQSPHYKDQFELWRTGAPPVFPFSIGAVGRASTSSVVFTPGN